MANDARRTPLYDEHVRLGARMIPFGGWEMPVSYPGGIIAEHQATRRAAGLFDLSHMGELLIQDDGATALLDELLTNDAGALPEGRALYSPMCRENGTIVDDVMLYHLPSYPAFAGDGRVRPDPSYLLVVNASNTAKDLAWIHAVAERRGLRDHVEVQDLSTRLALIAVQGPRAVEIVERVCGGGVGGVAHFGLAEITVDGAWALAARTGYTGEDGFELFVHAEHAAALWTRLLETGRGLGLAPVGLGARDTLRLEARLSLYGNDIDDTTTPLEAGLGWTVAWPKEMLFVGREALLRQKSEGLGRRLVGLMMDDRAVPRQHSAVRADGRDVGEVTSGTVSPTLERGIALAYVPPALAAVGTPLAVVVRGADHPAHVVKTPFYRRALADQRGE